MVKPKVICLCGSTRFIETFAIYSWVLEKQGYIVLGLHYMPPVYGELKGYTGRYDHLGEKEGVKEQMDELHLRKIDLADEVHILNIGGYIGESTQREIEY